MVVTENLLINIVIVVNQFKYSDYMYVIANNKSETLYRISDFFIFFITY